jgi:succinate dehydrogenase hydrophobic anchor subunit
VAVRVTALLLGILLPLHVAVVVAAGDVGRTTLATVADRLSGPVWPALEWATLLVALAHGFLVVRARITNDAVVVAAGVAAVLTGLAVTLALLTLS